MKKSFKKLVATTFASVALCFTLINTPMFPLISGISIETEGSEKRTNTEISGIQPLADDDELDTTTKL